MTTPRWRLRRLASRLAVRSARYPSSRAAQILADLGLTSAEINAGGFVPAPHLPIGQLPSGATSPKEYLATFEQAGITLTGLNVNGNPLNPDPEVGPKHAADLHQASLLGVRRIVAMSGLPAAHQGGRSASWVVNPWDSQYLDTLDYQWHDVVIPFWKDIQARARVADVKVRIEMHPHNVVLNPGTMERLATEIGATNVGAELDPSHLFWQGIDPVAAIGYLGGLVYHAAAKDTRINEANCRVYGVLDDRFQRVPADQHPVGIGGRNTLNRWPADASWEFVAVGRGHGQEFWVPFLQVLAAVDPAMDVNIEHEDAEFGQVEGLALAAHSLREAKAAAGV